MRSVINSLLFAASMVCFASLPAFGKVTPEDLLRQLRIAFAKDSREDGFKADVEEKEYVGIRTRTVTFSVGSGVYRVVFADDQTVTVSVTARGDLGAISLWNTTTEKATVEEIVNLIYLREYSRPYEPSAARAEPTPPPADRAAVMRTSREEPPSILRWNQLMDRVLAGDTLSSGGSSSSDATALAEAEAIARVVDPCATTLGMAGPRRAAVSDIAQALVAASAAPGRAGGGTVAGGRDEKLSEASRRYERHGRDAFLDNLEEHDRRSRSAETFRLMQEISGDTYRLFRAALDRSSDGEADPYDLAARRNFRTVGASLEAGRERELVESVLGRIIVDIDRFTDMRRRSAASSVIYDRKLNRYFVDPTLNSASQARYLLSVAVFYEWRMRQPDAVSLAAALEDVYSRGGQEGGNGKDKRAIARAAYYRALARDLAGRLLHFTENLHHDIAYPQ